MDARSLRSYRAWLERYVATERNRRSVAKSVVSGLLALLKVERDKIGAAPYDGCLRTLVEGIKPFVVRLGVKFSAVCKLAGFLKTLEYWQRDKFWDLVSRFLILCLEMLETSALGLGQDLGLLLVLEGAMTNSTYVSRFSFILIPYRFKVRDRDDQGVPRMIGKTCQVNVILATDRAARGGWANFDSRISFHLFPYPRFFFYDCC
ncbi:hypothetical protein F2Q70_00029221 [Brassica cretica]|uniref:Uncharacterized protein n=1 Tax=Brassica cretica TaxID=69181 RepID=A0A8S9FPP6_BRACR|nr:hypothetical protein F2Q70_00029221 [Brassica cretica]